MPMGLSLQQARDEGRELFRPREVAELGGFSEAFVRRLIASGKLDSVRIGTTVRVRFDAVKRLITEGVSGD